MKLISGKVAVAALVLTTGYAQQAGAGSNTTTFTVTAVVAAHCTVNVPTNITGLNAATQSATTTLSVACTNGTPWTVGLAGVNNAADQAFRMKSSGNKYVRYTVAATSADSNVTDKPTQVGSQSSNRIGGTGGGGAQSVTLTASAVLNTVPTEDIRFVDPATYTDTVTATVYF